MSTLQNRQIKMQLKYSVLQYLFIVTTEGFEDQKGYHLMFLVLAPSVLVLTHTVFVQSLIDVFNTPGFLVVCNLYVYDTSSFYLELPNFAVCNRFQCFQKFAGQRPFCNFTQ